MLHLFTQAWVPVRISWLFNNRSAVDYYGHLLFSEDATNSSAEIPRIGTVFSIYPLFTLIGRSASQNTDTIGTTAPTSHWVRSCHLLYGLL